MRYALIVFDESGRENADKLQDRLDFSKALSGITRESEGLEKLSDNVFLLCLDKRLSAFGSVLHAAQDVGFPYRVLFLEDPEWLWSTGT